jgi:hypothetical protein
LSKKWVAGGCAQRGRDIEIALLAGGEERIMLKAEMFDRVLVFAVSLWLPLLVAMGCSEGRSSGSSCCGPGPSEEQFDFTGATQEFEVPAGVASITVHAWGARGGNGWNVDSGGSVKGVGGLGGYVRAALAVTPGEILHIYVGGVGEDATTSPGGGGWNGGGDGDGSPSGYSGGGGGGASDVRGGGQALTDRILVAGGGGSGSGWCTSGAGNGGDGGDLVGANGQQCGAADVGTGGTQSAGGSTGGALGVGGTASGGSAGAAGGGGWYGGGASPDGSGGGGGSSYVIAAGSLDITHLQGVRDGSGMIIIEWGS